MEKGYDAGKKVSGIKRHIAVDTQGLPHAIAVTTADITDRKGCLLALERDRDNLGAVQKVLADGGYTGKAFASSVQALIGAEVEIAKRNGLHRFAVLPKRWVVERSFSWLEKNRRLWKNCERKFEYQSANGSFGFLGSPSTKTMNTFLDSQRSKRSIGFAPSGRNTRFARRAGRQAGRTLGSPSGVNIGPAAKRRKCWARQAGQPRIFAVGAVMVVPVWLLSQDAQYP